MSKLTIVIPTYNRHKYLLRSIKYWSERDVEVIIVDGSTSALEELSLKKLPSNISYHHLPIGMLERLEIASNIITTKYSILLGDDEFFIPSALNSAIKSLDSDPELVACCGQSLGFWPGKTRSWNPKNKILLSYIVYPERKLYKTNHNISQQRMNQHMENFSPIGIYAVVRTPEWKKIISIIVQENFYVDALFELQFELAISFFGKIKILDELFWLRSAENKGVSWESHISFEQWWTDPNKSVERLRFLQITANGLSDADTSATDIILYLKEALNSYLKFSNASELSYLAKIKNNFFLSLPDKLQIILKNILLYQGIGNPFEENVRKMIKSGTKVNTNELQEIKRLVLEFHNIKKENMEISYK